jgi:anti-anti-sigma regulatory factor
MHWGIEQDGEQKVLLRLSGSLTVQYAGELRQALMEALAAAGTVSIEFGEDLEIDIAGLQLLCSAHRTSLAGGRRLFLQKTAPATFRQGVEAAGLLRRQGCSLDTHQDCLWIGDNLS